MKMSDMSIEMQDTIYYFERDLRKFLCGIFGGHCWIELANVQWCPLCDKIKGKKK